MFLNGFLAPQRTTFEPQRLRWQKFHNCFEFNPYSPEILPLRSRRSLREKSFRNRFGHHPNNSSFKATNTPGSIFRLLSPQRLQDSSIAAHGLSTDTVHLDGIRRGNEAHSTFKLGALGSDLGAIACFFKQPWSKLLPGISESDQAWLLNEAGFTLRALGRLTEAPEPMRAGLEMRVKQKDWKNASRGASNLSELEMTLGLLKPTVQSGVEVAGAVGDGELSVTYADRSGNVDWPRLSRTTHADALHQAGRRAEAVARFREAEKMQAEAQPDYPLLYSQQGFIYCDLLLTEAERAAGRKDEGGRMKAWRRAAQSSSVRRRRPSRLATLLTIALNHLTLGRAALYQAILERSPLATSHSSLDAAVDGLRRAGTIHELPRGLLTRAWLRFLENDPAGSAGDLDEAWEIAERGSMKLHMADIHLYRARLFGRTNRKAEGGRMKDEMPYPWDSPQADLAQARRLIESCGYGRRKEELEEAEKAIL